MRHRGGGAEKIEISARSIRCWTRSFRPSAIIATNTSSISVTELAAITKRPTRFIGMHFTNRSP
jgi:3-hydroxybutyryl-CoA dehydrogenase